MTQKRSESVIRHTMRQLVEGLRFLHSLGIAHRDIKFENIIVDRQTNTPKYIDFGLSKVFVVGEKSTERFGTLAYSSPEVLLGNNHDLKTDIWSLGIVMHVLLSGNFPFLSSDKEKTKMNIVFQKLNFQTSSWLRVSSKARDLIS